MQAMRGKQTHHDRRRVGVLAILTLAMVLAAVTTLTALRGFAQPPSPVHRFFGQVHLPVPLGSTMTATIGGNVCGQTAVKPGYMYVIDVVSEGQTPGCGADGTTVTFEVAGIPSGSATWHSGDLTSLTLPKGPNLTPTPSPTATPTPKPSPTPASGWEDVALLTGCNPIVVTYADNMPSVFIAGAVFPEWILQVIWKHDPAWGRWQGYSPRFPQVSDLGQTDFLDAISICASGPGGFARPLPGITPTPASPATPAATLTPTDPTATPTSLPPGVEVVALAGAACNEVAVTYADNTNIGRINEAVSPGDIVVGIWKKMWDGQEQSWEWLGYNPEFPEISDLVETDFLDAISICVIAAGSFARPLTDMPPTPAPTGTPSPTPTPLPDSDLDGCDDADETQMDFDALAWYDFYDVPVPANPDPSPNGTRNRAINMGDVLATLFYVPASQTCAHVTTCGLAAPPNSSPCCADKLNGNGVDYDRDKDGDTVADGIDYDRSPGPEPSPPWDAGPPNGAINLSDVLAALAQVPLACTGGPPP
jgi:hypothetical protein